MADRFYGLDGRIVEGAGISAARKNHLITSVTSYLGVLAKPGLEHWKRAGLLEESFESAWMFADDFESFKRHVISSSEEKQSTVADIGKKWHDDIHKHFSMHADSELSVPWETLEAIDNKLKELGLEIMQHEHSFADVDLGYAGTIDAICKNGDRIAVVDWKVRTKPKIVTYDTWPMQLAAYAHHLERQWYLDDMPEIYNIIIPVTDPGTVYHKHWTEKYKWLEAFEAAQFLWCVVNNYDPALGEKFFKEDK